MGKSGTFLCKGERRQSKNKSVTKLMNNGDSLSSSFYTLLKSILKIYEFPPSVISENHVLYRKHSLIVIMYALCVLKYYSLKLINDFNFCNLGVSAIVNAVQNLVV
jgi:hypothetical protein